MNNKRGYSVLSYENNDFTRAFGGGYCSLLSIQWAINVLPDYVGQILTFPIWEFLLFGERRTRNPFIKDSFTEQYDLGFIYEWDLYAITYGDLVLYVGKSQAESYYAVFGRMWYHLQSGYRNETEVGTLIRVLWPFSAHFEIEFIPSEFFSLDQSEKPITEKDLYHDWQPCIGKEYGYEPKGIPRQFIKLKEYCSPRKSFKSMVKHADYIEMCYRKGLKMPGEAKGFEL